jgi:hypothetical protein
VYEFVEWNGELLTALGGESGESAAPSNSVSKSREDAFAWARASTAFFIAGAGLTASGVALLIFAGSRPERAAAVNLKLRAAATPASGGVVIDGAF